MIGEKETDPVLGITDLLIHLSADQLDKKARTIIEGEDLNILIGSKPLAEEKDAVKATMLAFFKEEYGIEEEDFRFLLSWRWSQLVKPGIMVWTEAW